MSKYGCSYTSTAVAVTINPAPFKFDVSVNGNDTAYFCPEDFHPIVTLDGTETGVSYQFKRNGVDYGTAITGNGNPIVISSFTLAGSYSVVATGTNGCTAIMNDTAVIIIRPAAPTASITTNPNPPQVCAGGSVILTASAGTDYYWSTTETTQSITVTTGGTYTVTVYDNNYCSDSASVIVYVDTRPTASASNSSVCYAGTTNINVDNPNNVTGSTYNWSIPMNAGISQLAGGAVSATGVPFTTNIQQTLTNTTSAPITVTITITPVGPAPLFCVGTAITVDVVVYPQPMLTNCPGNITTVTSDGGMTGNCLDAVALTHPLVNDVCDPQMLSLGVANGTPTPGSLPPTGTVTPGGTDAYTFAVGHTICTYTLTTGSSHNHAHSPSPLT